MRSHHLQSKFVDSKEKRGSMLCPIDPEFRDICLISIYPTRQMAVRKFIEALKILHELSIDKHKATETNMLVSCCLTFEAKLEKDVIVNKSFTYDSNAEIGSKNGWDGINLNQLRGEKISRSQVSSFCHEQILPFDVHSIKILQRLTFGTKFKVKRK